MEIIIQGLQSKSVNTAQYGQKDKWNFKDANTGTWYDSFVGKWNGDWREGDTLTLDQNQIQSREYNGKTYHSIKAPPEASSSFGNNNNSAPADLGPVLSELALIKAGMKIMMATLKKVDEGVNGKNKAPVEEYHPEPDQPAKEIQVDDEDEYEAPKSEINVEDIPFN